MSIRQQHRMLKAAFGHLVPPIPPSLLELAHAKIVYQEILRDCPDAHWDAANSAEFEASKAFKDALIAKTGIPENVWLSLGFVF